MTKPQFYYDLLLRLERRLFALTLNLLSMMHTNSAHILWCEDSVPEVIS